MNVAELIIQCLEAEDVKYIFGVPGEENEDLLFALQESHIRFVPTRHEQGAAFMADVWGRLTGQAGVCLSTLGPGATNLMTAVADAQLDKAPLVAITGQGSSTRLHHESHQMIDVVNMMRPIVKYTSSINTPEIVTEVVRKAFKLAQAEKPGAAHIELPEDIAALNVKQPIMPLTKYKILRPKPHPDAIDSAISLIKSAEQPIIIAGNGAIRTRASQALDRLASKTHIPVVNTFMGKGAVSERKPYALGTMGLGFKDYILEATDMADLIITMGYDIAEYDPQQWNPHNDKKIIHLDFEPAEVYTHYNPEVELVGDVADGIAMISSQLGDHLYPQWYTDIRDRIEQSIQRYRLADDASVYHAPGVILAVREVLPDDGLLISDVGSHKMWIARNFQTYVPNGCIISNGLASMGIALPGGIAASLVDQDRYIVCIMGDGGSMMNIQELETAHRLGVACVYIILNDNNYGLIEWKQEMNANKSFGTKLGNPHFGKLAETFDIRGYVPRDIKHFKTILSQSLQNRELVVIEIPIETDVNDQLIEELEQYFNQSKS